MAVVCGAAALAVLVRLATGDTGIDTLALPIGLPWLHANLRLDALSAVFLLAVDLAACLASVFGWSYARHDDEPGRVLPIFPLFIAGMNLVLVADDAFVFLAAWEFMSLTSWLLVLSDSPGGGDAPRGACLSGDGKLRHRMPAALFRHAGGYQRGLQLRRHPRPSAGRGIRQHRGAAGPVGCGVEGRSRPPACLAAAGPSRRTQPCLSADERGHDQGRHIRPDPKSCSIWSASRSGGGAASLPSWER